jgi:hypothetical protein
MTTQINLTDLAVRVEAAAGPSRELDCDIALRVGATTLADGYTPKQVFGKAFSTYTGPAYTASLDAAATLVPEGYAFSLYSDGCAGVAPIGHPDDFPTADCHAATPALALTAACLRARSP